MKGFIFNKISKSTLWCARILRCTITFGMYRAIKIELSQLWTFCRPEPISDIYCTQRISLTFLICKCLKMYDCWYKEELKRQSFAIVSLNSLGHTTQKLEMFIFQLGLIFTVLLSPKVIVSFMERYKRNALLHYFYCWHNTEPIQKINKPSEEIFGSENFFRNILCSLKLFSPGFIAGFSQLRGGGWGRLQDASDQPMARCHEVVWHRRPGAQPPIHPGELQPGRCQQSPKSSKNKWANQIWFCSNEETEDLQVIWDL